MGVFGFKKSTKATEEPKHIFDLQEFDSIFSILIVDSDHKIVYSNNQFTRDFGFTEKELLNQSIDRLLVTEKGQNDTYAFWKTHLVHEMSCCIDMKTKAGENAICRLKVVEKENGKFYLFFDKPEITESHQQKLLETVNLHLQLINHTPDIICFKDGEGKWLLANEADLELFHLSKTDYFGKTDRQLAEYTHPVFKDAFFNCMDTDEKCWQEATLSRGDELIVKPDGSSIILDVIKIPVFNEDGSRKNLIVLGRDVTARRNAESDLKVAKVKAEESDKLKSNFLATMSHELRTPLNAVIGFANLIFEEDDLKEIRDFSRIINNNSKMLLNLIEDVFDVSLIESDQVQIDRKEFDIIKSMREVYEIFPMELNMLDKLSIEFTLDFDRNSFLFYGDEFRIKQILTNLIRNALKFTKEGFIKVKLEIQESYIDLKVIDSGIGISKEKINEIFGLFRQVEEGSKRSFGGAGLGLSISKSLAEMMKGDILVESELEKGSTFTLRLPIEK